MKTHAQAKSNILAPKPAKTGKTKQLNTLSWGPYYLAAVGRNDANKIEFDSKFLFQNSDLLLKYGFEFKNDS